ncbi:hypothetical protein [Conexibacter woesei]|uniref:Uncharacterized protein n=1 Tax=Conexibacter woesei (strain DSM 14684 / CCUG 47730 / CIP 108061 / JCM 11494 / NBRC 100937 / ID131577) TaxID=469383 RepID=D3FAZ1_CONWI|nr:hypothetical protein [Conexibacter woesei]ADB51304.1 hypothetical protein Cwoe_2885 [Conexibacter woesei DSM 14684]
MTRRIVALLGVLGTLAAIGAVGPVSSASAFAWKDECYIMAHNGTASTARLVSFLPGPPIPGTSPAIIGVYIATGLQPGKTGMLLNNTGTPVTWGCHGAIVYATHAGTLSCSYSAPTRGGNSFGCNGVSHQTRWRYDDDDIYVDLLFNGPAPTVFPRSAAFSANASAAATAPAPGSSPAKTRVARQAVLRSRDLPGGGWTKTTDIARAGLLGRLWTAGDLPERCSKDKDDGTTPPGASGSLFVRNGGREAAGSLVVVEKSAADAKRNLADAMSPHSVGCLASLMRSSDAREKTRTDTTATVRPLPNAGFPAGAKAYRVTVGSRAGGKAGKPAYLDVVATRDGETWALFVFFDGTGRPFDDTHAAVLDVDDRID